MTLNFEKYSPDGVQSYVSRPCAQGRLFYLYPYLAAKSLANSTIRKPRAPLWQHAVSVNCKLTAL